MKTDFLKTVERHPHPCASRGRQISSHGISNGKHEKGDHEISDKGKSCPNKLKMKSTWLTCTLYVTLYFRYHMLDTMRTIWQCLACRTNTRKTRTTRISPREDHAVRPSRRDSDGAAPDTCALENRRKMESKTRLDAKGHKTTRGHGKVDAVKRGHSQITHAYAWGGFSSTKIYPMTACHAPFRPFSVYFRRASRRFSISNYPHFPLSPAMHGRIYERPLIPRHAIFMHVFACYRCHELITMLRTLCQHSHANANGSAFCHTGTQTGDLGEGEWR